MKRFVLLAGVSLVFAACGDDEGGGDMDAGVMADAAMETDAGAPAADAGMGGMDAAAPTVTFTEVQGIFAAKCGSHHAGGAANRLDLSDHASLIDQPYSSVVPAGSDTVMFVVPTDPSSSLVFAKIDGTFDALCGAGMCGAQMPLGNGMVTADELQMISDWITEGALDN